MMRTVLRCGLLASLSAADPASAELQPRLGGLAYYDTLLDITWAQAAGTNGNGTWSDQVAWVSGLTIGGVGGWRLPSADVNGDETVVDCTGGGVPGCEDNEMGHLYWEQGISVATPGPFSLPDQTYWSGTEDLMIGAAYVLVFATGYQGPPLINDNFVDFPYAWAVHDGDVGGASPVPVPPAAAALLGVGLAVAALAFLQRARTLRTA